MIKSAKRALTSIVGNGDVYDEELNTAICSAENPLNSRPVTNVGADDKLFLCQLAELFEAKQASTRVLYTSLIFSLKSRDSTCLVVYLDVNSLLKARLALGLRFKMF